MKTKLLVEIDSSTYRGLRRDFDLLKNVILWEDFPWIQLFKMHLEEFQNEDP